MEAQLLSALGLFLLLAGFIIGLGAVTVIDWLGFLGRTSGYWTETTIRTHKITKLLIWTGLFLAVVGWSIVYRNAWFAGPGLLHLLVFVLLVCNGLFLSLWVSPRLLAREQMGKAQELLPASWQRLIAVSFLISFFGWWFSVLSVAAQIAYGYLF